MQDIKIKQIKKDFIYVIAFLFIILQFTSLYSNTMKNKTIFTEISKKSGLNFIHFNGMSGELYFPEMTGQGGGLFDYDNDGDLDVYLIQGSILGPGKTLKDALFPPKDPNPRDRLFRNDTIKRKGGEIVIKFTDVTDKAGLKMTGYGMGFLAADFNNDGHVDFYVTNYGPNQMMYNNGDGTFRDVTAKTGTQDNLWGSSAAAIDFDKDGWLDLYVANYVHFDLKANKKCYAKSSRRDYCGPSSFEPQRDRFFRNRGDGTFEDVTNKLLIDYKPQSGLGVTSIDVNMDGWMDIYVTNDGKPNQLWINNKGKNFIDDGLFSGVALNNDGHAEASMGICAGDFDCDGDEDLFMTHIMTETNTLYVNDGKGVFEDRTISVGLSAASFPFTTFGTNWVDYNNDGWLDLFMANGAVLKIEKLALKGDPYPIHQPNQLFMNQGGKKFIDVSNQAKTVFDQSEVSRGAAFGDIDNDGDIDILVNNNNGPVRLLRNNTRGNDWLGIRLIDPKLKRDMLGTKLILHRENGPPLLRYVRTEGSYCASNDPRILFGLGKQSKLKHLEIVWPDGIREIRKDLKKGKYTIIRKGESK